MSDDKNLATRPGVAQEGGLLQHDESPRCSFCQRGRLEVKRMLTGWNRAICDECVTAYYENDPSVGGSNGVCSFCKKAAMEVEKLIVKGDASICDECVGLCADILEEEEHFIESRD